MCNALAKPVLLVGLSGLLLSGCMTNKYDAPMKKLPEASSAAATQLGLSDQMGAANDMVDLTDISVQEAQLRASLFEASVNIIHADNKFTISMAQDMLFAPDGTVTANATSALAKIAANLIAYPMSAVLIIGHTDNEGSASFNQSISENRAATIRAALIDAGVSADRLRSSGRGERQPVATNLTPEGRMQNRRIEIDVFTQS